MDGEGCEPESKVSGSSSTRTSCFHQPTMALGAAGQEVLVLKEYRANNATSCECLSFLQFIPVSTRSTTSSRNHLAVSCAE